MARASLGFAVLILLVLGVVGSLVAVTADQPTVVYMSLSLYQTDFELELQPSTISMHAGESKRFGVVMTNNRITNCGGPGNPCPNELAVFQFERAVVSLRTSGSLPNGISVSFDQSSGIWVEGGQGKTVSATVLASSTAATGLYSITIIAEVSWTSLVGPVPYQAPLSVGVNAQPPPVTTTESSMSWTPTKVGETYGQILVHYKNGQTKEIKSSKLVQLSLPTSNQVGTYDFNAFTMTYKPSNRPCVTYPSVLGFVKTCADDLLVAVQTIGEVRIDGEVVFQKTVVETFYEKDVTHFLRGNPNWKQFKLGDPIHASWSLQGFDPQPYFKKAYDAGKTSVRVEMEYKQHWVLVAWWSLPITMCELHMPAFFYGYLGPVVCKVGETPVDVLTKEDQPVLAPGAQADFGLNIAPYSIEIGTQTSHWKDIQIWTIDINSDKHFESTIDFSTSNLPTGVTGTFTSPSGRPSSDNGWSASTVLRVECSPTAKLGSYSFDIVATGGGQTHKKSIAVTVIEDAAPPPNSPNAPTSLHASLNQDIVQPRSEVTVSGELISNNDNKRLSNKPIQITSTDFSLSKTVRTEVDGTFTYTFDAPAEEGTYNIKVVFSGDDTYATASENMLLTVSSKAAAGNTCSIPVFGPLFCGMDFKEWLFTVSLLGLQNWVWLFAAIIIVLLILRALFHR